MGRILYLGDDNKSSTSYHRAMALERIGHSVTIWNIRKEVASALNSRIMGPVHYRTGYRFLQHKIRRKLAEQLALTEKPDLVWVNSGELFSRGCVEELKSLQVPVILYNNDDPTGKRDGNRFASLLKAIPYYDLCVVRREENIEEYKQRGARNVLKIFMSYDEIMHKPFDSLDEIPSRFRSEVAFVGTWMEGEKRDVFFLQLAEKGIPISIWGNHWNKSPHWNKLKPLVRGKGLGGRDYVAALQGAKICIGMLSKGNRDLHTRRSVEVPFAGSLLCAERTSEHQFMFRENEEAVFWDDVEECSRVCKELLSDDALREKITLAGMKRVKELKVGNEDVARQILTAINFKN